MYDNVEQYTILLGQSVPRKSLVSKGCYKDRKVKQKPSVTMEALPRSSIDTILDKAEDRVKVKCTQVQTGNKASKSRSLLSLPTCSTDRM